MKRFEFRGEPRTNDLKRKLRKRPYREKAHTVRKKERIMPPLEYGRWYRASMPFDSFVFKLRRNAKRVVLYDSLDGMNQEYVFSKDSFRKTIFRELKSPLTPVPQEDILELGRKDYDPQQHLLERMENLHEDLEMKERHHRYKKMPTERLDAYRRYLKAYQRFLKKPRLRTNPSDTDTLLRLVDRMTDEMDDWTAGVSCTDQERLEILIEHYDNAADLRTHPASRLKHPR